jgi:hypothetical protein
MNGAIASDAGIVDGEVDATKALDGMRDQRLDIGLAPDIRFNKIGRAAGVADRRFGAFAVVDAKPRQNDIRPGLGKGYRRRAVRSRLCRRLPALPFP